MIHTVLFDLDGTLTDSREGILNCLRYALEKMGRPVPEEGTLLRFIGPPLAESYTRWCGFGPEECARGIALFRERYGPVGKFENAAAPGMADLCRRLRDRGVTLAVASSKPESMCVPICARFGFAPYLRTIVGSPPTEEWEKADAIREALRRLDLGPADRDGVLMVGDRKYDAAGARECGIPCAGVEFFGYAEPGELAAAGAAVVVQSPEALEAWILRQGAGARKAHTRSANKRPHTPGETL